MFAVHSTMQSGRFRLKSFCEKLRFLDGLAWTVGLTVETKLRFNFQFFRLSQKGTFNKVDFYN